MRTPVTILLLLCLGAVPLSARTWTDVQGRTVEADFVSLDVDQVRIRRNTDGRMFSFPLSQLSAEDQAYAREAAGGGEDGNAPSAKQDTPAPAGEFKGLEWPRRVGLPDDYDVEVIREDSGKNEYVYRTPHFIFYSDVKLARKVVREFGKIFEATFCAMSAFPLQWNPRPPDEYYMTRLFASKDDYYAEGGLLNSGGVYFRDSRQILVPLSSLGVEKSSSGFTLSDDGDHGTLIHELTHQLHHQWLARLPVWMTEGMAVYMESVPYRKGEFRFDKRDLEGFAEHRIGHAGSVRVVPPSRLMTISHGEWRANFTDNPDELSTYYFSAFLLLNYFLYFDGDGDGRRINAYCRAIENDVPEEEARALLLDGRDYDALFQDMQAAYRREKLDLTAWPSS